MDMNLHTYAYFLIFLSCSIHCSLANAQDDSDDIVFQAGDQPALNVKQATAPRYLLYDVNPGEGFNLRRDVYMRIANLVNLLNEDAPWVLVLPPWGKLYHWKSPIEQWRTNWAHFFDLDSLRLHVPVIEFDDFLKMKKEPVIDEIYYLQRYKEGWKNGNWEERMDIRDCIDRTGFVEEDGHWRWQFWGFDDVYGKDFKCLSIQAEYKSIKPYLLEKTKGSSVFLVRGEELIHGSYSEWSGKWWTARRSLVFAKELRKIGDDFRKEHLGSTDELDKTVRDEQWTKMKKKHGDAIGGPYLAVHLRRRDFLYGHKDDVPSIEGTAKQIETTLKKQKLDTVFVATDALDEEYEELKSYMGDYKVVRFTPSKEQLEKYRDGGIAIIDQWICAHARYFMGTSVSTFTFRIHEEREILGFKQEVTYNRFCGDKQGTSCEQPAKWKIIYE